MVGATASFPQPSLLLRLLAAAARLPAQARPSPNYRQRRGDIWPPCPRVGDGWSEDGFYDLIEVVHRRVELERRATTTEGPTPGRSRRR